MLQTDRALRARKLTEQEEAEVPAIASINDLTKQTQSELTAEALTLALQLLDYEVGVNTLKAIHERAQAKATAPSEAPAQPSPRC